MEFAIHHGLKGVKERARRFFLACVEPVFMLLSAILPEIFHQSCTPGVVSSVVVCYNKYVSERHYCRLRMRDGF